MVHLNDIKITESNYKDILSVIYSGTNLPIDSRNLHLLRRQITNWDNLSVSEKYKCINNFKIITNVFNEYHIVRFLLSNMDKSYWNIIASLANETNSLYPIYYNIHGEDISILRLVHDLKVNDNE